MQKILKEWKSILESGMRSKEFFNFDKEGTVILSHYRSGGTQLRHMLFNVAEALGVKSENVGEIDFDLFNGEKLNSQLSQITDKTDSYKIIQLNNPMVISFLQANDMFNEITQRYNVIHLERESKRKNILSLGVWEELIKENLYKDRKKWTGENFDNFHCKLVENPLTAGYIYLGVSSNADVEPPEEYINSVFTQYIQIISTNRYIASTYNLLSISYEEYEKENKEFFDKYLSTYVTDNLRSVREAYTSTYKGKIPYFSDDFMEYYDELVQRYIREWKF